MLGWYKLLISSKTIELRFLFPFFLLLCACVHLYACSFMCMCFTRLDLLAHKTAEQTKLPSSSRVKDTPFNNTPTFEAPSILSLTLSVMAATSRSVPMRRRWALCTAAKSLPPSTCCSWFCFSRIQRYERKKYNTYRRNAFRQMHILIGILENFMTADEQIRGQRSEVFELCAKSMSCRLKV